MSIRNIDTQIMLHRTTDVAREAGILQKHPEVAQAHLAQQGKAESALARTRVQTTAESEMQNFQTDADGSGSGAAGGEGSGKGHQEELYETGNDDFLVPPSDEIKLIDLIV